MAFQSGISKAPVSFKMYIQFLQQQISSHLAGHHDEWRGKPVMVKHLDKENLTQHQVVIHT